MYVCLCNWQLMRIVRLRKYFKNKKIGQKFIVLYKWNIILYYNTLKGCRMNIMLINTILPSTTWHNAWFLFRTAAVIKVVAHTKVMSQLMSECSGYRPERSMSILCNQSQIVMYYSVHTESISSGIHYSYNLCFSLTLFIFLVHLGGSTQGHLMIGKNKYSDSDRFRSCCHYLRSWYIFIVG